MSLGVIVGSDMTQEWILPWWWTHYAKHNSYPVTFMDFGMTDEKKKWCSERGDLISIRIPEHRVKEETEITPTLAAEWDQRFTRRVWDGRRTWFKKPTACLKTLHDKSCWIDLDCEIRGSIAPIFKFLDHPSGLAMFKELIPSPFPMFNSGVFAFRKNHPILREWSDLSLEENHRFPGDQDVLSYLLAQKNMTIGELPEEYNWNRCRGDNEDALIFHWVGTYGKNYIRQNIFPS